MAITFTNAGQTVTVLQLHRWASTRRSGTIVHDVIGRGESDVTLGQLSLRTGTMRALVASLAAALTVEDYFTSNGVHRLDYAERPEIEMSFVLTGDLTVTLDEQTATRAIVDFGFQEVNP